MMKPKWLLHMAVIAAVVVAAFALGEPSVWAQGATPAPFDKVTVSNKVADRTLMKAVINADTARALVDACVDWQKQQPGNQTVAVYVLSPTGQIIDAHQMDGVLPIGAETALMKARTVLYARSSSGAVGARFKDVAGRVIRLDLGKAAGLDYYFVPGGLPIVVDHQMIGAIGVGGGREDEQCAYQALEKVLGPQPKVAMPQPPRTP
jgi:uncharacterized protein GlcG (DUF336 family)